MHANYVIMNDYLNNNNNAYIIINIQNNIITLLYCTSQNTSFSFTGLFLIMDINEYIKKYTSSLLYRKINKSGNIITLFKKI